MSRSVEGTDVSDMTDRSTTELSRHVTLSAHEATDDPMASGSARGQPAGRGGIVLQRLPLGRDIALRDLYFRRRSIGRGAAMRCRMKGSRLVADRDTVVSLDTYFGAFFEQAWHGPTVLRSLVLDLRISGSLSCGSYAAGRTGTNRHCMRQ